MQRALRLTDRKDFARIYRAKRSNANRDFVVYVLKNRTTPHFRMGVSISKRIGNAVVRNRLKRRIKEIVRHQKDAVKNGSDFIIIVRKHAVELDYWQMQRSLIHVLKRAHMLDKPNQTV